MAATKGAGNPDWTQDETILALDLYFRCGQTVPGKADARVQALSAELRSLRIHEGKGKVETFRNPEGVAFKLQNLRSVATGKGLKNVSRTDVRVWQEYGQQEPAVRLLAERIRHQAATLSAPLISEPIEFVEGRLLTHAHTTRERQANATKLLAHRRRRGTACCEGCGWAPPSGDDIYDAGFEAHHIVPMASWTEERTTRPSDLALLCATCHRLIHRLMHAQRRWVGMPDFRDWLAACQSGASKKPAEDSRHGLPPPRAADSPLHPL